ncbi:hypothetical protein HPP92_006788 [Vanilla planifolia]|uniref:HMA domain-containing protein n=1 Tax=Vanilla planifolia TaxID=51239 RepID=A0A835VAM4_VANPL|nr:hypothetical protein HPP92_006788 [Vanilla planifolia]
MAASTLSYFSTKDLLFKKEIKREKVCGDDHELEIIPMEGSHKIQTLRILENLSLPKVQIVVIKANMGCDHCRRRVSAITSKMSAGILEYKVDLGRKEVTVMGIVKNKKKSFLNSFKSFPGSLNLQRMLCFSAP